MRISICIYLLQFPFKYCSRFVYRSNLQVIRNCVNSLAVTFSNDWTEATTTTTTMNSNSKTQKPCSFLWISIANYCYYISTFLVFQVGFEWKIFNSSRLCFSIAGKSVRDDEVFITLVCLRVLRTYNLDLRLYNCLIHVTYNVVTP